MSGSCTELRQTAEAMASGDYRKRFAAEREQLRIRTEALRTMLGAQEEGFLDFEPDCPVALLEAQLHAMELYGYLLGLRAEAEGTGEV